MDHYERITAEDFLGDRVMRTGGIFSVSRADTPALAQALEMWAMEAEVDAARALDDDNLGRAARLHGKAQGFRIAAAEIRKASA